MGELITISGTVSEINPPNLNLNSDDGQLVPVELGNLNYASQLGLVLEPGERVSVVGSWDTQGGFAASQITVASSAITYSLRDDLGRPLWRGGRN